MPLTALELRQVKPGDRPRRLTDGRGLYLLITPKGSRWWRYDYRFDGTRKTLSLGVYPEVGLADARETVAGDLLGAAAQPVRLVDDDQIPSGRD